MDSLRGHFGSAGYEDPLDHALADDEDTGRDLPPSPIGQDERRMQVRAYNHWASLLGDRKFPSIEDLQPETLPDFGPSSVLLDFTGGIEDPAIRYLGPTLAAECDVAADIARLADVPPRSLLSRITDHYLQILANQAPIGFEAEFVNQRGASILYRGILLPYSSDDDTIDFIYGVINWKEIADQLTSDELLLEIDQALQSDAPRRADPVTDWADGPGGSPPANDPLPVPAFGTDDLDADDAFELDGEDDGDLYEAIEAVDDEPRAETRFASLLSLGGSRIGRQTVDLDDGIEHAFDDDADHDFDFEDQDAAIAAWQHRPAPVVPMHPAAEREERVTLSRTVDDIAPPVLAERPSEPVTEPVPAVNDDALDLYDCLADARELALAASASEDRSRGALYAAVGRAYDFSIAAQAEPDAFAELMADSGLTMQDRAPMTPVVKLVFGADYDKTRLTEYAAVLSHAHRVGIERGTLARYLGESDGGLKGVVQAERQYRRGDGAEAVRETPREALARKLRAIAPLGFEDIPAEGEEFALVMIRRTGGEVVVLGEVADVALVEKAGRKLVA